MYPNLPKEYLWGPSYLRDEVISGSFDKNSKPLTVRKLLTDLGQGARVYNNNVWVESTLQHIEKSAYNGEIAIITDVRFKHELKAIKGDFYTVRVLRPNRQTSPGEEDISEIDLDDVENSEFDKVIINDGTLQDLEDKINEIVRKLRI